MSDWITDRRPTEDDADILGNVFNELGIYTHWTDISYGRAWMPIIPPAPYVKPRRWTVQYNPYVKCWSLHIDCEAQMILYGLDRDDDDHRQAAERIADIYEEVMP